MFSRFSVLSLLAVPAVLSFCVLSVLSAPTDAQLVRRQVGNLQCNLDRLAIVTALGQTKNDVNSLASAGSSDSSVTSATSDALTGINSAQDGIATIAKALISGQTAPADARDQVGQGLTTAQNALNGITSTDPNVTSALSKATGDLNKAITAGQGVVSNCK
ncbi:uncharacterized protein FOMMEDRAFT_156920 [Fomitiporia mediterranea MF3/22]|uniref:uncharacterized protein n=1 Tax=Fomitiporia mediterranea (strain MF3/22) TaxID=694068 RepID=UPI0004407834|nr:uncharacterized protein FOMMEDRAFT_156920 [Fomitiporia mediterranea MF3/22]EJD01795.1 hypothetical protein FOMMEDRAFT_156920 [Fomitiporia mediterranea MF3/22]